MSVLLSASVIQERTGYTAFSIPSIAPDDSWTPTSVTRQDTLDKESRRVRAFLDRIVQTSLPINELSDAARIWEDSFHPVSNCLLMNRRSDLVRMLGCLHSLGIPAKDLEAHIPDDPPESNQARWKSTRTWLDTLGLTIHKKNRLPLSTSRLNAANRVGLILRSSTSHELGYQQTLNRALFVTSVWLSTFRKGEVTRI